MAKAAVSRETTLDSDHPYVAVARRWCASLAAKAGGIALNPPADFFPHCTVAMGLGSAPHPHVEEEHEALLRRARANWSKMRWTLCMTKPRAVYASLPFEELPFNALQVEVDRPVKTGESGVVLGDPIPVATRNRKRTTYRVTEALVVELTEVASHEHGRSFEVEVEAVESGAPSNQVATEMAEWMEQLLR